MSNLIGAGALADDVPVEHGGFGQVGAGPKVQLYDEFPLVDGESFGSIARMRISVRLLGLFQLSSPCVNRGMQKRDEFRVAY